MRNKKKLNIILGSGLSGIGAHSVLKNYDIFEASNLPFGHAKSRQINGFFYDQGAHICHSKDSSWLEALDVKNKCVYQTSNVKNFYSGKFINYPIQDNLRDLSHIQIEKALISAKKELAKVNKKPKNYYEWCKSQYGEYITENFYRIFTDKYWRTDMEDLSTDWLGGRLLETDIKRLTEGAKTNINSNAAFNKFYYPKEKGFGSLFDNLIDLNKITFNKKATNINVHEKYIIFNNNEKVYFDNLISTIPLNQLIFITDAVPIEVTEASKKLKYLNLIQINARFKKNINIPKNLHWFYVYDNKLEPSRISILNNLTQESNNDNYFVVQAEIFRRNDEVYDIKDLVKKGLKDLYEIFNVDKSSLIEHSYELIEYSYIVSDHERKESVNKILNWLESQSIISTGLYGKWFYVWSDIAYSLGVNDSKKIKL